LNTQYEAGQSQICGNPVFLALERLKWEDCEFKASLGYIVRPYFKKSKLKLKTLKDDLKNT
jgi:hypothetical protein